MIVNPSIPCLGPLVNMTDMTSFMVLYSDLRFTSFVFTSTFGLLKHFDALSWLPCWHDWYVPLWDITTDLCVSTSALCLFWCLLASLSCLCVCFLWAWERENIWQMHQNLFKSDQKMHELIKNWQHSIVWHDELKLHLVDILPAGEDIVFSILLLSFVWLLPSFVICNCKMSLCVCTTCSKEHLSWRPRKKHKQDVGKKREEERGGF